MGGLVVALYPAQPVAMQALEPVKNPLDEFRNECTIFYDQLKAFHDRIIQVPQKDRKNFEHELDQLNYTQMTLADKAVNIPYYANKPTAKQVVDYLQLALVDLDRLMYPPEDIKPERVDVIDEVLDGAIAGTVAGISKVVFAKWDETIKDYVRSVKTMDRSPPSVSELADEIGYAASKGGFSWPGIFPFAVGLFESAIGAAILPFNPVAGGILLGDGVKRVVQGIQENIQAGLEGPKINPPYQ